MQARRMEFQMFKDHYPNLAGWIAGAGSALAFISAFLSVILIQQQNVGYACILLGSLLFGLFFMNLEKSDYIQTPVYVMMNHQILGTAGWSSPRLVIERVGLAGAIFGFLAWVIMSIVYAVFSLFF